MSAPEPHPEPSEPEVHTRYISLPLHCGIGPRPGSRLYVVWRANDCPQGPFSFAGIHIGAAG
eukprot:6112248-Amphidinium_carterae.1